MDQEGRPKTGSPQGDERLMPIGIFSRMTGLSHRALRLYADRGLLPPARVDETTGYRYYDVHSIRAAEMIRLLRRLGVPLGEMGLYIDAAATDRLEETLTQQKQRLEQEQARLDAALRLLGQDRRARRHVPRGSRRRAHRPRAGALPALVGDDGPLGVPRVLHRPRRRAGRSSRRVGPHPGRERVRGAARSHGQRTRRRGRDRAPLRAVPPRGRRGDDHPGRRTSSSSRAAASRAASSPASTRTATASPTRSQLEWLADSGRGLRGRLRMRFVRDERDTADPADFATELIWPVTEPLPGDGAEERPPDLTPRLADALRRRTCLESAQSRATDAASSTSPSPAPRRCAAGTRASACTP